MRTLHATTAPPRGLREGDSVSADWLDAAENCGRPPRGRSGLVWAIVASVLAASAAAFAGPVPTSFIYGIDDGSQLWVMGLSDTSSATAQLLGPSTLSGSSANGLAYDRSREQLFGADTVTSELYWWQQGAPTYTSLGSISTYLTGGVGEPVSAAFYDNAYWFLGNGSAGNVISKLSLTYTDGIPTAIASGTTFVIGGKAAAASGGGDMVITPTGTLYAYSAQGLGDFFSADLNAIASGTVGGYNLIRASPSAPDVGLQLSLGVDDATLYGHDYTTGNWFVVNTSDGSTTQVAGFTTTPVGGKGFRDLGGASIQPVPEPSTLALAAIGGLMVTWQVARRRRRKAGRRPLGTPPVSPPLESSYPAP